MKRFQELYVPSEADLWNCVSGIGSIVMVGHSHSPWGINLQAVEFVHRSTWGIGICFGNAFL